jgi:hypothetical protein
LGLTFVLGLALGFAFAGALFVAAGLEAGLRCALAGVFFAAAGLGVGLGCTFAAAAVRGLRAGTDALAVAEPVVRRAASRRALVRWGRVRGRLASTPFLASTSWRPAFFLERCLAPDLALDCGEPLDVSLMAR